ncbi:MAG: DUF309 domain-containing protein [Rhodobacter sp.]|nr:DUF309 domain-containing protein [Rhodobacter sp.]
MTLSDGLPPYPYVPGATPRHPEGAFDAVRATARAGMDADALAASDAFQTGLRYLQAGYFWEAHEVLEPVWMACAPNSGARAFVQALIQFANARLKARMDRPAAAVRLCDLALAHLAETAAPVILGQDVEPVRRALEDLKKSQIAQYNA